jgi:hypothetical protein
VLIWFGTLSFIFRACVVGWPVAAYIMRLSESRKRKVCGRKLNDVSALHLDSEISACTRY